MPNCPRKDEEMNTNIDWDTVDKAYTGFIMSWQDITAPSPRDFFDEGFLYGLNQGNQQALEQEIAKSVKKGVLGQDFSDAFYNSDIFKRKGDTK